MATVEELRNKYLSNLSGNGNIDEDTEPEYMALYRAKKEQWGQSKVPTTQNKPSHIPLNQITEFMQRQGKMPIVDKYMQEGYKLNKQEVADVKQRLKEKENRYFGDVGLSIKKRSENAKAANNDYEYRQLMQLNNKINPGSGVMSGIVKAFDPAGLMGKSIEETTGTNIIEQTRQQQPLASGIGYGGSKIIQYGALSPLISKIPGVSAATAKGGATIGKGISALSGGKIAAKTAGDVATRLLTDTAVDVALDTVPEAISNASKGQSGGEIAKNARKNIAVNVGFNLGAEGLGAAFKAIRDNVFTKEQAEMATQALKEMDEATKTALAKESGFNSVKEMEQKVLMLPAKAGTTNPTMYVSPELGASRDINQIKRPIPTTEESISAMQKAYQQGEDITQHIKNVELSKWYDNLSKEDKILLQSLNEEQKAKILQNYSPVNAKQVLRRTDMENVVDDVVRSADEPLPTNLQQADNALNVAKDSTMTTNLPKNNLSKTVPTDHPQTMTIDGKQHRISKYSQTIPNKTDYPEEIKQRLAEDPVYHEVLKNADTLSKAEKIANNELDEVARQFDYLLSKKAPEAVPLAEKLAKMYIDNGMSQQAAEVTGKVIDSLTEGGQFIQAAAILARQGDPMTARRIVQKQINDLNANGIEKFGKKWRDFELTEDELKAFADIQPGDSESINAVMGQIGERLAKEYPTTIWEKFVEGTRVAMLLNPRTQVRNFVGNMAQLPMLSIGRKLSAIGQNAYKMVNPDFVPTQSLLVTKKSRKLADDVWETVKGNFDTPNKYADNSLKGALADKPIFKDNGIITKAFDKALPGVLEKVNNAMGKDKAGIAETLRRATYELLEMGDTPFVKKNFVNRLSSLIEAQGIKNIDDVSQEAIDIATTEALKATFKDDNAFSNALTSVKRSTGKFGEVVLPFTKTPANIAMRGIDFSPAGLINTISQAKKSKDISKTIDELSKNLTGTGMIAAGIWMYDHGLITGSKDTNKKKSAFMEQNGFKPYAFATENGYFTYDWAQPMSIPLLLGTAIAESNAEGAKGMVQNLYNALITAADTWFELSPLKNIKEIFGGYGTPMEKVVQTVVEMPQRLIPSVAGATARVGDRTQRVTYSNGDVLGTQVNLAKSKIPGVSDDLPAAYTTWGDEKVRDDTLGSALFNNYVNPGSYGKKKTTKLDNEVTRLYDVLGDENVFPRKSEYTLTKNGESYKLDNKEYSQHQQTMGSMSKAGRSELIALPAYKKLTDKEKSDVLQRIYSNAKETADFELLKQKGVTIPKTQESKIKAVYIGYTAHDIAEYYLVKEVIDNAEGNKGKNGKTIPGTAKVNAINRLVDMGYSRSAANRLYTKVRGN